MAVKDQVDARKELRSDKKHVMAVEGVGARF
jgi:hypothetical protein